MVPTYSFVIPVHDEEATLEVLHLELSRVLGELDGPSEVVFVDDGSTDRSHEVLLGLSSRDTRCQIVRLSRNFGHQLAVTAGLDAARGAAVIVMDADLQDPPSVVPAMVERWREGFQVVYGVRTDRTTDTRAKRLTAAAFYGTLRRLTGLDIPAQAGDFRLMDRAVVDALGQMPESNRFLRGMVTWLGFRQTGVPYSRAARFDGETSYTWRRMLSLAGDGITGFSRTPLDAVLLVGAAVSTAGAGLVLAAAVRGPRSAPARAMAGSGGQMLLAGAQLVSIGVIGQYLGRVLDEARDRPHYIVQSTEGFEAAQTRPELVVDLTDDARVSELHTG